MRIRLSPDIAKSCHWLRKTAAKAARHVRLGNMGPGAERAGGGLRGQNCEGTCGKGEKWMRKLRAMLRTQHAVF